VLELAGVAVGQQRPRDGTSLVPLIDGTMDRREKPLGFWDYPEPGIGVQSAALLQALQRGERTQQAQRDAELLGDRKQYPKDVYPGHAAWLDGNWKLHRIADRTGQARYELYDLAADEPETTDLASQQPDRVAKMTEQLAAWQQSVMRSLNGEDYSTRAAR
jgi:hypothetical protein